MLFRDCLIMTATVVRIYERNISFRDTVVFHITSGLGSLKEQCCIRVSCFTVSTRLMDISNSKLSICYFSSSSDNCCRGRAELLSRAGSGLHLRGAKSAFPFVNILCPRVVVLEKVSTKDRVGRARRLGAIVIGGDATHEETLEALRVHRAKRVFIATGNDEANVEAVFDCINLLREKHKSYRRKAPLEVFVEINDPTIAKLFATRVSNMLLKESAEAKSKSSSTQQPISLQVFNPAANCVRKLIEPPDSIFKII